MSHSTADLGDHISSRIDELAAVSDAEHGLTRLYLGPAHRRAADLVRGWMDDAGMQTRLDGIGNVVGRFEGRTPDAPVLLLGSHIDTVRDAGRFDGPLGVITAIEVVHGLERAGCRRPFAIEVVAFGDEEGVRFPSTLGGSRAVAGAFDPAILAECDRDGISRDQALRAFGCDPATIAAEARPPQCTLGYLEVHIEQGPVLEQQQVPVGVVTGIVGATRASVDVRGASGHAGTVPMGLRRDALAAAAEMLLAIERRAAQEDGLVATVGRIEVPDGAPNTIPGAVRFSVDVRSPADDRRQRAVADIEDVIRSIARARRVDAALARSFDAPAAPCDDRLSDLLARAVARSGVAPVRLASGAGHDAMAFRGRVPIAMLFVRCRAGISHNPAEYASPEDIDVAARVLADFVATFEPLRTVPSGSA